MKTRSEVIAWVWIAAMLALYLAQFGGLFDRLAGAASL